MRPRYSDVGHRQARAWGQAAGKASRQPQISLSSGQRRPAETAVADPKGRQDPASFEELQNFCEKRFNRK